MSQGAPTKYQPEYDDQLIGHMATGYSFESFGAVIDVSERTLYNWADSSHESFQPSFLEAKQIAFAKSRLFWERAGITGLLTSKEDGMFNAPVWIFNMKNRFGWKNNDKVELAGDKDNPIVFDHLKTHTNEEILDFIFEQGKDKKR